MPIGSVDEYPEPPLIGPLPKPLDCAACGLPIVGVGWYFPAGPWHPTCNPHAVHFPDQAPTGPFPGGDALG